MLSLQADSTTRTTSLFEPNPFLVAARIVPFWVACGLSTIPYGYVSTQIRSIKAPMLTGFSLFTAGIVGLATVQPTQSTNAVIFSGLAGIGFRAPLVLVVAGVQLSTPHHLIATATALTTSARAVAATLFTAIFGAALNNRLDDNIPAYVTQAALSAGLNQTAVPEFLQALSSGNQTYLLSLPGVTGPIIRAGSDALNQAFADSVRVVYIIAAPFGLLACILCFFLGDLREVMDYKIDAPVESVEARQSSGP